MLRVYNPYRPHLVRFESSLSVAEATKVLFATDKARLGSGWYEIRLRVRIDGADVVIDPQPADVTMSSAHERVFQGTLQPGSDPQRAVLTGSFILTRWARMLFFPVLFLAGAGIATTAVIHRSFALGAMAAFFLYFAISYLSPRLMLVDTSRYEVMIGNWLTGLLTGDEPHEEQRP